MDCARNKAQTAVPDTGPAPGQDGIALHAARAQLAGGHGHLAGHGTGKTVRDPVVYRIREGTNGVARLIVARSPVQ